MTEAEILNRLQPGSWVGKVERRALEGMLAQIRSRSPGAAAVQPQYLEPPAPSQPSGEHYDHIAISGSPAFTRATRKALDLLRQTPSWAWAKHLRGIRESPKDDGSIAGYVSGGVFTVMRNAWSAGSKIYASLIVHEGTHAARGHAIGIEEEKIAYRNQVQALRELGASWWTISTYQGHADNPTHNFDYKVPQ